MSNPLDDPLFDPIENVFADEITDDDMPKTPPKKYKKTSFAAPHKRPPVSRPMPAPIRRTMPVEDDDSDDEEIENFDSDEGTSFSDIIEFLKSMSMFLLLIFIASFVFTHKKFKDFVAGYVPDAVENSNTQGLIISGAVTSTIALAFVLNKLRLISF